MYYATTIGEWVRPHPDAESNPRLEPIRTMLYERPDDSAIPKTVTVNSVNEDGEVVTKDVPFHDSILGASATCDGCGEPFGQQIKIKRDMWVSPTQITYLTNKGKLYFCQDVFACLRRAKDRVGTVEAAQQMTSKVMNTVAEVLDQTRVMEGQRLCANPNCGEVFYPNSAAQKYHLPGCGKNFRNDKIPRKTERREYKARGPRKGSARGRSPKETATV